MAYLMMMLMLLTLMSQGFDDEVNLYRRCLIIKKQRFAISHSRGRRHGRGLCGRRGTSWHALCILQCTPRLQIASSVPAIFRHQLAMAPISRSCSSLRMGGRALLLGQSQLGRLHVRLDVLDPQIHPMEGLEASAQQAIMSLLAREKEDRGEVVGLRAHNEAADVGGGADDSV